MLKAGIGSWKEAKSEEIQEIQLLLYLLTMAEFKSEGGRWITDRRRTSFNM